MCVHHYIINDENRGICKKCGQQNSWPTSFELSTQLPPSTKILPMSKLYSDTGYRLSNYCTTKRQLLLEI